MTGVWTCLLQGYSPALKPLHHGDSLSQVLTKSAMPNGLLFWMCYKNHSINIKTTEKEN